MYKDNYCWYVQVCSNVHQRSEQSKIKSKKFVSIQSSSFKSNLQSQSNISKRILIKSNPQSNPNYRGLVQSFCLTWFTWKKYFIFYSGQQLIMICCSTSLGFSKCEGYGLDWQSNPSTTIPHPLKRICNQNPNLKLKGFWIYSITQSNPSNLWWMDLPFHIRYSSLIFYKEVQNNRLLDKILKLGKHGTGATEKWSYWSRVVLDSW